MSNGIRPGVRNTATVLAAAIALLATGPAAMRAQVVDSTCRVYLQGADFVGAAADLARVLDLQDTTSRASFAVLRAGRGYSVDACRAPAAVSRLAGKIATRAPANGVQLLAPELLVVGNTAYPRDWNDGALWSGRGMNAALTAGARFQWGPLSAAIAPVAAWQANAEFDIRPRSDTVRSEFASAWWNNIDTPQRFGPGSFTHVEPGQSYARVDVRGFGLGISTENIRWGPSQRNPLLLSGTAAGFAHAFIETGRPVDIWIGDLEFQLFWGRLEESEYFDSDPDNDRRMLAGLLVAFQPRPLDGLTVGAARLQALTWWPELSLGEVVLRPYRGVGDNVLGRTGNNQLISAFFRWATAPAGIEVYGEWAREDHWDGWTGLLRNLDASQAWTLGLQKVTRRGDDALRLSAEVTHLSDALPINFGARTRGVGFYTHTAVRQGHTHKGQLLGAPIGTGAESLFFGADYFWDGGRTGVSIERARYEDDVYNIQFAPYFGAHARDSEVSLRAGHLAAFGPLSFDGTVGWSLRYNRNLLGLSEIRQAGGGAYRRDDTGSLRLGARWTPPGPVR
jgi:hypothetical protein